MDVSVFRLLQSVGFSAFSKVFCGKICSAPCLCDLFVNVRFKSPISLYTFGYRRAGKVLMDVVHNRSRLGVGDVGNKVRALIRASSSLSELRARIYQTL
jgi:hypothetical protein